MKNNYFKKFAVTLCGKRYKSYRDAAMQHHMDHMTLIRHVQKYGKHNPKIFETKRYNTEILIGNKLFPNFKTAQREIGITKSGLERRIKKHGQEDLRNLNASQRSGVTVAGQKFDSLKEAADIYGITPHTLRRRLNYYGERDLRVICKKRLDYKD